MTTATDITDPLVGTYIRVLPAGEGVCDVCHGAPGAGWPRCWSCADSIAQVSQPVTLVVPISLTELLGQLHHSLRSYKRDDYPAPVRDTFQLQVSALLARFLSMHRSCIARAAGGDWDVITVVPSSAGRTGPHPLERIMTSTFPVLREQYRPLLLPGPNTAGHNLASDTAYITASDVRGKRVLLVDDTFTSGARLQSAASALQLAGARVIAGVPIGRVVNPGFSEESAALLSRAKETPFDFARCCLDP